MDKYINNVNDINKNIIEIVNLCLKSYLVNINFEDLNKKSKLIEYNKKINCIFEDKIVDYGFIINNKFNENFKIKLSYQLCNKLIEKILDFNNNNIIELNDGNTLSKIIIGNYLKNNIINVEEEIKLSKKYNVLSKNTSLFAEIKKDSFLFFKKTLQIKSIKFTIDKEKNEESEGFVNKTKKTINNIFNNIFTNKKKLILQENDIISEKISHLMLESCDDNNNYKNNYDNDNEYNYHFDLDKFLKKYKKKSSENENNDKNINDEKKEKKEENKIKDEKIDIKNIILTQDIMEGYWEKNNETEKIINKINDIYEKIKNYLNEKKIEDNLEKILLTFIMIYYIENKEQNLINDYLLILEKGKKYLKKQNISYNVILNDNNL